KPYWVNDPPSTPLREGIRSYFAHDVVRAVGIGVAVLPSCRSVQAPLHPPATEGGRGPRRIVAWQGVRIEEAGRAGIALLGDSHLDAYQRGLVGQHVDEAGMGDAHNVLIVALAHVRALLPKRILADAQGADALGHQQVNDTPAGGVQVPVNAPRALGRNPL